MTVAPSSSRAAERPGAETGPMVPVVATIDAVTPETPDVSTYTLRRGDGAGAFRPGQFNMLYLPGFGEAAISLSSDAEVTGAFAHTIRFVGNVTRGISRLQPGDTIGVRGPFGSAWPLEQAVGHDLVIVAGGIGLAPLRPVLCDVVRRRDRYRRVTLLYGARTPADLLYVQEYDIWRSAEIDVHVTVDRSDDGWRGTVGVVAPLFYRFRIEPKETFVFTCGPEVMMHFVIYEALARRVPKGSIWISLERSMNCGIGHCGRCQYGPLLVCRDGPVLSFARMEPYFNREEY